MYQDRHWLSAAAVLLLQHSKASLMIRIVFSLVAEELRYVNRVPGSFINADRFIINDQFIGSVGVSSLIPNGTTGFDFYILFFLASRKKEND
jgi:hypothetical protein